VSQPFRRRAALNPQPGKFCRVYGFHPVNGNGTPQNDNASPEGWRFVSVALKT
jgi:hypothetical protein